MNALAYTHREKPPLPASASAITAVASQRGESLTFTGPALEGCLLDGGNREDAGRWLAGKRLSGIGQREVNRKAGIEKDVGGAGEFATLLRPPSLRPPS